MARSQLAVDVTLVSPLSREGLPHLAADTQPWAALARAAQRQHRARRCRLVVFGIETGGRWSEEAASFLRLLARARAASAPPALRNAVQAAWVHRWGGILSVAAQRSFAASLLELPAAAELGAAGDPHALHELLADARWPAVPVLRCVSIVWVSSISSLSTPTRSSLHLRCTNCQEPSAHPKRGMDSSLSSPVTSATAATTDCKP